MTDKGATRSLSITLRGPVLEAAMARANQEHRSLETFVEHVIMREVMPDGHVDLVVLAPEDTSGYRSSDVEGEDPSRAKRRKAIVAAALRLDADE